MDYLNTVSNKRFIYINAPAGYGKTVSASIWVSQLKVETEWIRLSFYDNNLADFCMRFVLVIHKFQPENANLSEIARYPAFYTAPMEFAMRAAAVLTPDERERAIIFDDLHLITNEAVLNAIPVLMGRLPHNYIIMFLSRALPPESFLKHVVKNEMALVESDRLIFSVNEISRLFQYRGYKLTKKQAEAAFASTEGWAMGVNALLISGCNPTGKEYMREYLNEFLKNEIWDKWDMRLREFLLKVSVADDLTPPLCRTLTDEIDSEDILHKLVHDNAFISIIGESCYRFHHLFKEFLLGILDTYEESFKYRQYNKVAEWYFERAEYYKATEYFMKCKNYEGVDRSLRNVYSDLTKNSNIENRVAVAESLSLDNLPESVMQEYPFVLVMLASVSFSMGKPKKMMDYIDRFTELIPKIASSNPEMLISFSFVQGLDFRRGLIELTWQLKAKSTIKVENPTKSRSANLTQNLPFFHRSQRDYSEYAIDMENNLSILRETFGYFIGVEYDAIEDCIRAGLYYEQGKTQTAHKYALSANAKVHVDYTAETKFCAMMILAEVLHTAGRTDEASEIIDNIKVMLEQDKALFLIPNLQAYEYKLKITNGDINAANEWLQKYGIKPDAHLRFYKISGYFTAARALIAVGDNKNAVVILENMYVLCEEYRRPLDILETHILLSIAYKGIGNEKLAYINLERAAVLGKEYGFTQMFANEGAAISHMLHKLSTRAARKDYSGGADASYVKMLYLLALEEAKHTKGLTSGINPTVRLSKQQALVMKHMANGCTYNKIAENMGLKYDTVRTYIETIYKKLGVSNAADAVMKVRKMGLMDM